MRTYLAIKFHLDNRNRELVEQISTALAAEGIETVCMARDFENWGVRQYSAEELMRLTFAQIDSCDIVVVEFSEKGVGLGIEAGYAYAKGLPVLVLLKRDEDLSKTMEGIASTIIRYDTIEGLELGPVLAPFLK